MLSTPIVASRLPTAAILSATLSLAAVLFVTDSADAGDCQHFRRGDTDGNGSVQLSDGVATLNFLFLGTARPTCQDAADADDSGDLSLADALYTFNFLFLGGERPSAPGPFECGKDDTSDSLFCEEYAGCGPPTELLDLSGFAQFRYVLQPAFGFCVEEGGVLEAEITREEDGGYTATLVVIEMGEPGNEDCLPTFDPVCLVGAAQDLRPLTAAEVERMLALFSEVAITQGPNPICDCVAIDPCAIPQFSWDDLRADDFDCSSVRVPPQWREPELTEFVRSLIVE